MSVVGGVTLVCAGVFLGIVGVFTLFLGVGVLILLVALILFIVGIFLLAQGDPNQPPHGYWGHPHVMPAYPQQYHGYPGYPVPGPAPIPAPPPMYPPPVAAAPAERYCPSCGAGNLRVSAFCHKCGKPLPPPP